jgi:ectoine hydroxylase-related dioxygenase (phytanoyl-CoA dioxygenase family)
MVETSRSEQSMMFNRVDDAALAEYRDRGWLRIRNLFGADEVARWRDEADRLVAEPALTADPDGRNAVVNSRPRADRIEPITDLSPLFLELARDARVLRETGALLGGAPRMFKDKFIAKPPGAQGYGVHQDYAYWPGIGIAPERIATVVLFLDRATAASGAIECVPGIDRLLTRPGVIEDPDESRLAPFQLAEAEPGDLMFLSPLVPHRSGTNASRQYRRALFFNYAADADDGLYARFQGQKRALPHGVP